MSNKIAFPVGLTDDLLKEKEEGNRRRPIDWNTEVVDTDEGWVYARKGSKRGGAEKGKRLRKFFQPFGRGYDDDGPCYWKPKLDDLVTAEAKRWKALQYKAKQMMPLLRAFELVRDNAPFCCIRITDNWPEHSWAIFPKNKDDWYGINVSWNWVEGKDPPKGIPHKQDVGNAWFEYEDRSREIRRRVSLFETLFYMAIEKRYSQEYYKQSHRGQKFLRNLIINGRQYLIGRNESGSFGVVAYPEEIVTEQVTQVVK